MRRDFLIFKLLNYKNYGTTKEYISRINEEGIYLHYDILEHRGISQEVVELTEKQVLLILTHQSSWKPGFSSKKMRNNKQKKQFEHWVNTVFYWE